MGNWGEEATTTGLSLAHWLPIKPLYSFELRRDERPFHLKNDTAIDRATRSYQLNHSLLWLTSEDTAMEKHTTALLGL